MTERKTKSGKIVAVREPKDLIRYSYQGLSIDKLESERDSILAQDITKNIIVNPEKVQIHVEVINELISELSLKVA